MIVSNNSDDATATTKNVKFVMAFTDDKTQDKWAVASAKKMIYKSQLPAGISKSISVSDGASCYCNKLLCALQPCWKSICGVDEVEILISLAGRGKSELDGMFGRLSHIMRSSVDDGNSHDRCCFSARQCVEKQWSCCNKFSCLPPRPCSASQKYAALKNTQIL